MSDIDTELLEALEESLRGHYATWMAACAEVEGSECAAARFEELPEVIEARAAIAKAKTLSCRTCGGSGWITLSEYPTPEGEHTKSICIDCKGAKK